MSLMTSIIQQSIPTRLSGGLVIIPRGEDIEGR